MTDERAFVHVYTANGMLHAETIRLFLSSQGIEAMATQESAGISHGLTIGPMGEARILVPSEQAEDALELLQAMEEGHFVEDEGSGSDEDDSATNNLVSSQD